MWGKKNLKIINPIWNFIIMSVLHIHILRQNCILLYNKTCLKSRWTVNTCFYCQWAKLLVYSTLGLLGCGQNSLRNMLTSNARSVLLFAHSKLFCDMNWNDCKIFWCLLKKKKKKFVKSNGMQRKKKPLVSYWDIVEGKSG